MGGGGNSCEEVGNHNLHWLEVIAPLSRSARRDLDKRPKASRLEWLNDACPTKTRTPAKCRHGIPHLSLPLPSAGETFITRTWVRWNTQVLVCWRSSCWPVP